MTININIKVSNDDSFKEKVFNQFLLLTQKLKAIMKSNEEILTELTEISTTVAKIGTETSASLVKIDELQAAVDAGGGVPQPIQDAIDSLKVQLKGVDDLVPDAA